MRRSIVKTSPLRTSKKSCSNSSTRHFGPRPPRPRILASGNENSAKSAKFLDRPAYESRPKTHEEDGQHSEDQTDQSQDDPKESPHAIENFAKKSREESVMDEKVKSFSKVIASNGSPSHSRATRPQIMVKSRLRNVKNLALSAKPIAKLGVFAIKEEPFVEPSLRSYHQTCSHHLFDFKGPHAALLNQARRQPIRRKPRRMRKGLLQHGLLAKNRPQSQLT